MAQPIEKTVKYFCPLSATVYSRGRYGDWEDYLDVYDGIFLVSHEKKINDLIQRYDDLSNENPARFFDGSSSVATKLQKVIFGIQNVDEILYGCIQVNLSEPFVETEEAEFLDWLEGQCAYGYGKGLEQCPIRMDEGDLHISFWNGCSDYFLLREKAFDIYING